MSFEKLNILMCRRRTIDTPWPPVQVLRWKVMLFPLLIAIQSSWFVITLSVIKRLFVPTSTRIRIRRVNLGEYFT
jgi:hypothetical protein